MNFGKKNTFSLFFSFPKKIIKNSEKKFPFFQPKKILQNSEKKF